MAGADRGKGPAGKGTSGGGSPVDAVFRAPLTEFIATRNALAAELKKAGDAQQAEGVKAIAKPSLSAWAANQLYWRHRAAFDQLLAAGDRFRTAQAAQLAGQPADLRAPLDARRDALGKLTKLAAEILRESAHPASPDTMRRIMTTLEALATYGTQGGAPPAGRLTADVDPPGFEALAALVPRTGGTKRPADTPSRIIPFSQKKPETLKRKAGTAEEARRLDAERRRKQADAMKALQAAERALKEASRAAEQARTAMRNAAALAKDKEQARAALETRLERAAAEADAARREARQVASQAEDAAQAMDDAERVVARAREMLKDAES